MGGEGVSGVGGWVDEEEEEVSVGGAERGEEETGEVIPGWALGDSDGTG